MTSYVLSGYAKGPMIAHCRIQWRGVPNTDTHPQMVRRFPIELIRSIEAEIEMLRKSLKQDQTTETGTALMMASSVWFKLRTRTLVRLLV